MYLIEHEDDWVRRVQAIAEYACQKHVHREVKIQTITLYVIKLLVRNTFDRKKNQIVVTVG